jgi:atypical dual specificity phosphatase
LQGEKDVLVLHRVEIKRGGRSVIRHASLKGDSPGLVFVVGSGGAGKSTLLTALANAAPDVSLQGMAELDGRPIGAGTVPTAWQPQHADLRGDVSTLAQLTGPLAARSEQVRAWLDEAGVGDAEAASAPASVLPRSARRLLARMAALCEGAELYLADEPTADLDDAHADMLRRRLADLGRRAAVVVATHNRRDCLALGGRTALLAGGTVQECIDTAQFFVSPATAAGRTYVQTGNCNLPCDRQCRKAGDGIWWVVPGLLCGMSRPGLVLDAAAQYRRLAECGVRLLVCTEERCEPSLEALRSYDMALAHFAVPDMASPSFSQAVDICRMAEPLIRSNEGVAVHCRGGLGRTGTVLAALLIWFGDSADQAIDRVRAAQPLAIQSMAQSRFLHDFADRIRGWH